MISLLESGSGPIAVQIVMCRAPIGSYDVHCQKLQLPDLEFDQSTYPDYLRLGASGFGTEGQLAFFVAYYFGVHMLYVPPGVNSDTVNLPLEYKNVKLFDDFFVADPDQISEFCRLGNLHLVNRHYDGERIVMFVSIIVYYVLSPKKTF